MKICNKAQKKGGLSILKTDLSIDDVSNLLTAHRNELSRFIVTMNLPETGRCKSLLFIMKVKGILSPCLVLYNLLLQKGILGTFQENNLFPLEGAIEAVNQLFPLYDLYFLSSPMWGVPESYIGKRIWIEKQFGVLAKKRLILSHRKDLHIGDFLVDDRTRNGAGDFKGFHIHFGTPAFPDWKTTLAFLIENC